MSSKLIKVTEKLSAAPASSTSRNTNPLSYVSHPLPNLSNYKVNRVSLQLIFSIVLLNKLSSYGVHHNFDLLLLSLFVDIIPILSLTMAALLKAQ